jgi:hypothetical protein
MGCWLIGRDSFMLYRFQITAEKASALAYGNSCSQDPAQCIPFFQSDITVLIGVQNWPKDRLHFGNDRPNYVRTLEYDCDEILEVTSSSSDLAITHFHIDWWR